MTETPRASAKSRQRSDPDLDLDDVDDIDLRLPPTLAWRRRTAIEMVISGALGLLASFVLSIDAVKLAADPKTHLGCSINQAIDCVKVGLSAQSHILGESFPNAFLGIAAESVVITIAVAIMGGVIFPRWFMFAAQVGYTFGLLFAYWLFAESLFVIHALCPWCMVLYLSTTLVWWLLARFNVREGNLFLPPGADRRARELVRSGNDVFIVIAWIVLLVALVLAKYGSALFT